MFKESEKDKQMNLFSSLHTYLSGSAGKFYLNLLFGPFFENMVFTGDLKVGK